MFESEPSLSICLPWTGLDRLRAGRGSERRDRTHSQSQRGCEAGRIASLDVLSSPASGPRVPRVTAVTQIEIGSQLQASDRHHELHETHRDHRAEATLPQGSKCLTLACKYTAGPRMCASMSRASECMASHAVNCEWEMHLFGGRGV